MLGSNARVATLGIVFCACLLLWLASRPHGGIQEVPVEGRHEQIGLRREPASLELPRAELLDNETTDTSLTRFIWQKKTITSTADADQAAFIINRGRGDLLEPFIQDDYRAKLLEVLLPIEDALRATAQVYDMEVKRVKEMLRARPDRTVLVASGKGRELDPSWQKVQDLRQEVEGKTGAVWGDWDPASRKEIHYIMLWDEWPGLRALFDDQATMLEARRQVVTDWVREEYDNNGVGFLNLRSR